MTMHTAHDAGIPAAAYTAAGLILIVVTGLFIAAVIVRAAKTTVPAYCPHPDLDDFPEETRNGR